MYQEFSVISVETLLNKKQIVITTNKDIGINSFNDTIIEIYERASKSEVMFNTEINGKLLIITLRDWPIPNSEYILSVKGLKSVIDEKIDSNIKKRIKFESTIVDKVEITNPSMHEKIKECVVEFKLKSISTLETNELGCYFEIATDNAFINVPVASFTLKKSMNVSLSKPGQYFLRARVQQNIEMIEYGEWSEVISFIYGNIEESGEMPEIEDPDNQIDPMEPEVDLEEFELISTLEQGVTPESLMLEFSKTIDALSVDNIIIIRKAVR